MLPLYYQVSHDEIDSYHYLYMRVQIHVATISIQGSFQSQISVNLPNIIHTTNSKSTNPKEAKYEPKSLGRPLQCDFSEFLLSSLKFTEHVISL